MNLRKNQQGFTIVELLIVVVVIAILAAISIVAYTGITARANNSTAAATAKAVKDTAINFQGANGSLPTTRTLFVSGGNDAIAKLPSDITFLTTATGTGNINTIMQATTVTSKQVSVMPCGATSAATATGYRIFFRNFSEGTGGTANFVDAGDCSQVTPVAASGVTPVPN